ncbi:ATP-dependent permease [Pestalotiopsis sp. IQ-011]
MPMGTIEDSEETRLPMGTPSLIMNKLRLKHLFAFTTWNGYLVFCLALFTSLLVGAIQALLAVLIGRIFSLVSSFGAGSVSEYDAKSQISRLCGIMLMLAGAGWAANFLLMFSWGSFSELQVRRARFQVFAALLEKDIRWYDNVPNGISSLLVQTQCHFKDLRNGIYLGLGNMSVDLVTTLANISVALYFSWKLTFVILVSVPVSMFILGVIGRKIHPALESQKEHLGLASKYAASAVTAIDLVKVFNGADQEIWQYSESIKRSTKAYLVQSRLYSLQVSYVKLWLESLFVFAFYYGITLVSQGVSSGDLLTAFYAALNALQSMESIVTLYPVVLKGLSAGQSMRQIIAQERGGNSARVSFSYAANPSVLVLDNMSLRFPARQMSFLIGPSGTGKSTIVDLMAKFYQPNCGEITLDGTPIEKLDDAWVRKNVALIQQKDALFDDTLHRNIILGLFESDEPSESDIRKAVKASQLQATIAALPSGMQTRIGMNGHSLSGGQRQRLILARALIRNSAVLILDEAMTGLDITTRAQTLDTIRRWRRQKTTIVITHDTAQIRSDDYVCVIQGGHVTHEGQCRDMDSEQIDTFSRFTANSENTEARQDGQINQQMYATLPDPDVIRETPRTYNRNPSPTITTTWVGMTSPSGDSMAARMAFGIKSPTVIARPALALRDTLNLHVTDTLEEYQIAPGSIDALTQTNLQDIKQELARNSEESIERMSGVLRSSHTRPNEADSPETSVESPRMRSTKWWRIIGRHDGFRTEKGIPEATRHPISTTSDQIPSLLRILLATWPRLAVRHDNDLGGVLKVINLIVLGLAAATQMVDSIPSISAGKAASGRLLYYANLLIPDDGELPRSRNPLAQFNPEKLAKDQGHTAKRTKKQLNSPFPIRMNGLSFAYQSEMGHSTVPILNNIDLVIDSGSAIAVTGHSGCGKSSLVSLLLNIRKPAYVPQVRNVRPSIYRHSLSFAGLPPESIDIGDLRSQIAYVPQQPFLFPTTIRGNIIYGLPDSSEFLDLANVERAARRAGILDFVMSLSDGFNTLVGDGGQDLSGGQAQRICLARALVRHPKLLILDEPTSALDPRLDRVQYPVHLTILAQVATSAGPPRHRSRLRVCYPWF